MLFQVHLAWESNNVPTIIKLILKRLSTQIDSLCIYFFKVGTPDFAYVL